MTEKTWTCFSFALAGLAASIVAGCGSHSATPGLPAHAAGAASVVRNGATVGTLYVAASGSHLYAFAPGSTTPKLTITTGIFRPTALAFDANKTLYVGNVGPSKHGSIAVYANGQGSPIRTIEKGLQGGPFNGGMVVASDGTLINGSLTGISEYQPGATAPFLKIARQTTYVALASATTFYASGNSAVSNFTIGMKTSNFEIRHPFMVPGALGVDSTGTLYVVDACGPGCAVYEFDSKGKYLRLLSNVDIPVGVFIDGSDNAWINNYGEITPSIDAFHPGQTSSFIYITDSVNSVQSMTVDAAGTLYIGNGAGGHDIVEYASGSTTPTLKFALPHNQTATSMVIAPPGL